ncbi:C2H2-type zinc-finger transcription factor [Fusarium oxysporum f. sp. albedinis]|nr:C2H2-type zinc-finger transcription factor [Fusarium oxysporum f. sp. albedinis]
MLLSSGRHVITLFANWTNLLTAMAANSAVLGLCSSLIPRVTEKVSIILPALATNIEILIVPIPTRSFRAELLIAILAVHPA